MAARRLTIDLRGPWHADPDLTDETRDEIVRILQDSEWNHPDLVWMLASLAQVTDAWTFDKVFAWIWDLADTDSVYLDVTELPSNTKGTITC